MALKESSYPVQQQRYSWALVRVLSSAVQEWLLIFMLFISALYSFLITKFAGYCKLQIPCVLCSRLDHVLGKEKSGYLWHMVCPTHRLEISSLVACHAHNQLVDVHNMCESCLFSFATINKSNAETYRLLVGKLGEDPKDESDEDPLLDRPMLQNRKTKYCSCCNEPWTSKGYVQKLIHTRSFVKEGVEFDLPLPGPVRQNQDLRNKQAKSPVPVENTCERSSPCDYPFRIGYKEVKITSDTESEVSMSKDDDCNAIALVTEPTSPGIDLSVQCEQLGPRFTILSDDLVRVKLLETDPAPSLSHVGYKKVKITSDTESEVSLSYDDDVDARALVSETPSPATELFVQCKKPEPRNIILAENSVTEKLLESDLSPDHSFAMSEMIVHPHNDAREFSAGTSKSSFMSVVDDLALSQVTGENKISAPGDVPSSPKNTELSLNVLEGKRQTSLDDVLSRDATEDAAEVSKDQSDPVAIGKAQKTCVDVFEALDRPANKGMDSEMSIVVCPRESIPLDLGDAYQLAVGNRAKQLSEMLAEQWLGKDSPRVSEDIKLLLSQLSAARGLDQQMNDMSPKISLTSDELKASAPSTSTGMQFFQKRISLERNESSLSVDGSIVSEIEGESEVDRLKRQVEHDLRTIKSLYKELEEERNASAVAANQAMAMITRLQEEKATFHMEALQNVRMMEEQAEFDIEAMQEANDLLAEREKEIQDLEAELEFFRQRYPIDTTLKNLTDPSCDMKSIDIGVDYSEPSHNECSVERQRNSMSEVPSLCNKAQETDLSLSDILNNTVKILLLEDEASDILQNLKKLERKLFILSDSAVKPDSAHVECTETEVDQIRKSKEPNIGECSRVSDGGASDYSRQDSSVLKVNCTDSLENEISNLNTRLESLEADRKFLSRFVYALNNGKEGLECIQEIANNLRELRKIEMRKWDQSVA